MLADFLLDEYPRSKDDVLALDYLPLGASKSWGLPKWDREWRDDMNKQLTHITYARVLAPHSWDHRVWVPKLRTEFVDTWKDFRLAITNSDFQDEFTRQISICEAKQGFANIPLR